MAGSQSIIISVVLPSSDEAVALAQYVKRVGYEDVNKFTSPCITYGGRSRSRLHVVRGVRPATPARRRRLCPEVTHGRPDATGLTCWRNFRRKTNERGRSRRVPSNWDGLHARNVRLALPGMPQQAIGPHDVGVWGAPRSRHIARAATPTGEPAPEKMHGRVRGSLEFEAAARWG